MNALLQILSNLLSLIKDLPLKNKMVIMVMLILFGGGYLYYDRYLDYRLNLVTAQVETASKVPDSLKSEVDTISERVSYQNRVMPETKIIKANIAQ